MTPTRCGLIFVGLLIFTSSAASQEPSSRAFAPRTQTPAATAPVLRAPDTGLVMSHAHVLAPSLLPVTDDSPRQVRGALFGALWGGGVGLFLGAIFGSQIGSCGGEGPCGLGGLRGAVVGGIAAALLGAILGYHLTDDEAKSAMPAPGAAY